MATKESIDRPVKFPENSPFLGQTAQMLEFSWGVSIKSADSSENHCKCCPNSRQPLTLSSDKEIIISGPIVKVYLFIDVLFGIVGIP